MTKKKFYDECPRMEVVELKLIAPLLTGSLGSLTNPDDYEQDDEDSEGFDYDS